MILNQYLFDLFLFKYMIKSYRLFAIVKRIRYNDAGFIYWRGLWR